jgi:hypothetical protein
MRSAISTPHPLAQERQHAGKRGTLGKLRAVPACASNRDDGSNGLTPVQTIQTMEVDPLARPDKGNGLAPAKTIQKDDAPPPRQTAIQKNGGESQTRLAMFARIDALRIEIRKLIEDVALAADIELLDLMRDEVGSYSRHRAAQEARTWAGTAGIQLETRLMMLDRALRPASNGRL